MCDSCNQYFATKIEKLLLEQPYFRNVRHRARIESKKGRVLLETAISISPEVTKAEIIFDRKENKTYVVLEDEEIEKRIFSSPKSSLIIPAFDTPELKHKILSRFLAKVAVQAMLYRVLREEGGYMR